VQGKATLIGTAAAVLVSGIVAVTPVETRDNGTVSLGVPGRMNANASVVSRGSFVGVAWTARTADGATDVYSATSRDAGRTFSAPVRVNQVPGDASVSGEQPPRVVLTPGRTSIPSLVVLWTAKSPSGTRLVSARSADGGKSFGTPVPLPGSTAAGNRGWESAAVTARGEVVAVWLDHREAAARPGAAAAAHQHGDTAQAAVPATDGVARAQLSQIFFANLSTAASAHSLAAGVCYCCKTSIATGSGGTIVAAWRHVYPGSVRDIAFAKSTDGGRTFSAPVRVSDDNWVLNACPENGPVVAVDHANAIHVVWPTLLPGAAGAEPTLALFYATSKDGVHFTKRQQLPTEGAARHPQLTVDDSGAVTVAWDEQVKSTRRIVLGRGTVGGDGVLHVTRQPASDEAATYPVVSTLPDATLVLWTSGTGPDSVIRVERYASAK
jgi:hypothetical protein